MPAWLPATAIATTIPAPTIWTTVRRRIDRPYCVLSKHGLRDALPVDGAVVVEGRAAQLTAHQVTLTDGRVFDATAVLDTRGLPGPGRRRAASAHGVFVDEGNAAPMIAGNEGLLLDWRPENGAGPTEPPSFLYAVPIGDGTVIFEETSLGLRGGMPQHELRKRLLTRLTAHGIQLTGTEPCEAAHYPLDQPPPPKGGAGPIAFGSRGGAMHPCTGYSVADSLALVDTAVGALQRGRDPIIDMWSLPARAVYWMRMRGLYGLGRLTTEQSAAMFDAFFASSPRGQRALLSARDDYAGLGAVLFDTVAHTWPFRWRYDLVGWTNRNRWLNYEIDPATTSEPRP